MTPTVVQVAHWLQQLPAMVELLPRALVVRPASIGTAIGTGAAISHSPVPLNVHAMALLDQRERNIALEMAWVDPDHAGVQPYLQGWVIDIACDLLDAFPDAEPEPHHADVATACAWLRRHLPFAAILPQWPELAAGIEHVHRAVDVATRHLRVAGQTRSISCGACKRGRLRVAATQRDLLLHLVRSTAPGRRIPIWLLLAVAAAPAERGWVCSYCRRFAFVRPVTLPQAAAIIATDAPEPGLRTLQRWARNGRFTRIEARGVKLYDLGEILAVAARYRLREGAPNVHDE